MFPARPGVWRRSQKEGNEGARMQSCMHLNKTFFCCCLECHIADDLMFWFLLQCVHGRCRCKETRMSDCSSSSSDAGSESCTFTFKQLGDILSPCLLPSCDFNIKTTSRIYKHINIVFQLCVRATWTHQRSCCRAGLKAAQDTLSTSKVSFVCFFVLVFGGPWRVSSFSSVESVYHWSPRQPVSVCIDSRFLSACSSLRVSAAQHSAAGTVPRSASKGGNQ